MRGSNPDAALYWLVRMLDGGADPLYLARRIIRMAAEDIGLADSRALGVTLDAAETYGGRPRHAERLRAGAGGGLLSRVRAEIERGVRSL